MQLTGLNKKAGFTMVEMLVLDKNKHDRKSFTCGNAQLDRFLKEQANKAEHENRSRTKILVDSEISSQIIGFYTLSYGDIPKAPAGSSLAKYPHPLPVLILGRTIVVRCHLSSCQNEIRETDYCTGGWVGYRCEK